MNTLALYGLTVLIWGSSWFAIRYQLDFVPPEVSLFYRFLLASIILIVWCLGRGISLKIKTQQHFFLASQGFCMFGLNYVLFYHAAFDLVSGLLAVVFSMITGMNIFNGAVFLKRPIRTKTAVGAAIGLCGMGLVFWPEITSSGKVAVGALIVSVAATYSASLGNILSARNQASGISVTAGNAIGMTYGTIFLFVYCMYSGSPFVLEFSLKYLGSLMYLAFFASVIAFGCYLTLIGRIGPGNAAYATVLAPIIALALSTGFEGYQWQARAMIGVGFVLIGNILVLAPTHALIRAGRYVKLKI